jgi:putative flippase GtrA
MKPIVREAAGYLAASGCALLVDMSILWWLVHVAHLGYEFAAAASFLSGAVVAYQLSVRIAFRHRRLRDRRTEFVSFVAIGAVGLAVNAALMLVAIASVGLALIPAKCVAAVFTFTCNFLLRRQILFIRRPSASSA